MKNIQIVVGLAGFFVVLAIAAGPSKAALATISVVVAYLLEFYALRSAMRFAVSGNVDIPGALIGMAAIAVGALLVCVNFWAVLVMATVCVFLLDALTLRFEGVQGNRTQQGQGTEFSDASINHCVP